MGYADRCEISELIGKTITEINGDAGSDRITFACSDGSEYLMYHSQDCCESVSIDDIVGDLSDLIGSPIVDAREDTSAENPKSDGSYQDDSFTWTFYTIQSGKGAVTIRWYGSSNGYYSESVDFECSRKAQPQHFGEVS